MAVPDYESIMLPLLKLLGDKQEHAISDLIAELGRRFDLSDQDLAEVLPSGPRRFSNRVHWAKTYLKKAGLLVNTSRGRLMITDTGLTLLSEDPPSVTAKTLERFPLFLEFKRGSAVQRTATADETAQTPEEELDASYQSLRRKLADELLEAVRSCSPKFFEVVVVDLLVAMGYGGSKKDAQSVGRSGDGGIDGVIKEDRLGLDVVYVQAKRWEAAVGRPVIQAFIGSLEGQKAKKGVIITTSRFSAEAREYVNRVEKKVVLIDGEELAQLMIDHGIGVTTLATYVVKGIDSDYFAEGVR